MGTKGKKIKKGMKQGHNTDAQCSQKNLDKITKPFNDTFAGYNCMLQCFSVYFV